MYTRRQGTHQLNSAIRLNCTRTATLFAKDEINSESWFLLTRNEKRKQKQIVTFYQSDKISGYCLTVNIYLYLFNSTQSYFSKP